MSGLRSTLGKKQLIDPEDPESSFGYQWDEFDIAAHPSLAMGNATFRHLSDCERNCTLRLSLC
jgi:hypothetical protein